MSDRVTPGNQTQDTGNNKKKDNPTTTTIKALESLEAKFKALLQVDRFVTYQSFLQQLAILKTALTSEQTLKSMSQMGYTQEGLNVVITTLNSTVALLEDYRQQHSKALHQHATRIASFVGVYQRPLVNALNAAEQKASPSEQPKKQPEPLSQTVSQIAKYGKFNNASVAKLESDNYAYDLNEESASLPGSTLKKAAVVTAIFWVVSTLALAATVAATAPSIPFVLTAAIILLPVVAAVTFAIKAGNKNAQLARQVECFKNKQTADHSSTPEVEGDSSASTVTAEAPADASEAEAHASAVNPAFAGR
jgi:hypothetical protein